MIADVTTHEELYVALVGGIALIVVATVPLLWNSFISRKRMQEVREAQDEVRVHLPPNGDQLYEMVQRIEERTGRMESHLTGTDDRTKRIEGRLDHLESVTMAHLESHLGG